MSIYLITAAILIGIHTHHPLPQNIVSIINHRPSYAFETGGRLLPKIRKQMEDVTGDAAGAPAGGDVAEVSTQSTAGNVSIRDDAPQQKKQYNFIRKRRAALCYRRKKGPNQNGSNHPHGSTPTNNADATAPSLPTRPSRAAKREPTKAELKVSLGYANRSKNAAVSMARATVNERDNIVGRKVKADEKTAITCSLLRDARANVRSLDKEVSKSHKDVRELSLQHIKKEGEFYGKART